MSAKTKRDPYAAAMGRVVRKKREKLGLTCVELAERMKTSAIQISRWELGKRRFHPVLVARLAKALECPPEEIYATSFGAPHSIKHLRSVNKDLYEALNTCVELLSIWRGHLPSYCSAYTNFEGLPEIEKARAALEKARDKQ
ncbi:MAG: helix-turn-helix transcriptional regulator [Pseudomonadota bacterium]